MNFGEYLKAREEEAIQEARSGKEYSGTTWHGYYAYWRERDSK
jgi:hypothetical protein